ncbi:MAG: Putative NAD/FAD-dependent oxidoreductase [uncultured Sulfurovum sp.]|uniref:NAD/FAD-dependent oxidoreductase n=1 Tax=uncultured Sulfurovum sp. TaxID=269237 RepID=A0A6S6U5P4_9BACT|nr:MAG: Putative NAD/FAD-dependent oxidoreductase [uncultured Sulfurovum sp.]
MKIAIVGAGFSGSYLAHQLHKKGHSITLFEKSRGVGGRMATRSMEQTKVNHGCNALQTKTEAFQSFCELMVQKNLLEKKDAHTYTASAMNTFLKYLSQNATLKTDTLIKKIVYKNNRYTLTDQNEVEHKDFEFLLLTLPAPQILNMDFELEEHLKEQLKTVQYESVATLVLTGKTLSELDKIQLSKINSLKKISLQNNNTYVIHMDKAFSNQHNHLNKNAITPYIVNEIQRVVPNFKLYNYNYFTHLWKYGFTSKPLNIPYVYNEKRNYAISADWLMGESVEDAFLSAKKLLEERF